MNRRDFIGLSVIALASKARLADAFAAPQRMTVYKSPSCGCCKSWIKQVKAAGIEVHAIDVDDVTPYKTKYGVPEELQSCHTGVLEGYAFEGHVPVDLIKKLVREKPKGAKGLAVPGMPVGSPGMEMALHKDAYDVVLFEANGKQRVYAKR